jgi:DNA-binding NarL/FixJ family response regulator
VAIVERGVLDDEPAVVVARVVPSRVIGALACAGRSGRDAERADDAQGCDELAALQGHRGLLSVRTGNRARGLSERERDVLRLVASGLPNKLIARRLEISEKTVKKHLTSVYQQIVVTDRTQAALWAQRNGLA